MSQSVFLLTLLGNKGAELAEDLETVIISCLLRNVSFAVLLYGTQNSIHELIYIEEGYWNLHEMRKK